MSPGTQEVLNDVRQERMRQDAKWGFLRSRPFDTWYRILGEEVGEVAKALNEREDCASLRAELIQVAAVAVQIVEDLDRRQATKNPDSSL